jgi:PEP-CTERM motif-containing protein
MTVRRRRRTSRHRRNRLVRRLLFATGLVVLATVAASLAVSYLAPSLFRTARSTQPRRISASEARVAAAALEAADMAGAGDRKVYPYSVVPGGVRDAKELKWAAEHDPVVAAHYAGFDYERARVVRLVLAQTVYVSYRIGGKVYWTRHRISLKKGETVITDGKITARTRCGNRVEEMPQQATSSSEPPAAKFEEPIQPAVGTAVTNLPVPFQSALLNRPNMPGFGPAPPLGIYDPIGGGSMVPIAPPELPAVCGGGTKKPVGVGTKKKGNPCGGAETVPEPGTWLLMGSGLLLMFWKTRHLFQRAASQ